MTLGHYFLRTSNVGQQMFAKKVDVLQRLRISFFGYVADETEADRVEKKL